jgi:hypothetical protein
LGMLLVQLRIAMIMRENLSQYLNYKLLNHYEIYCILVAPISSGGL